MVRLWRRAPVLPFALLFLALSGCGGGSYSIPPPPPPPPQPDFSIGFSQNSVSVLQGATSQAVNLFVNSLNGFTGSVQVTLSGLPSGVVSSPASPFSIPVGSSTPVLLSAAPNASTGSSTISAQGTSGSLSHPASLGLTIQAGVAANLPRTTYSRTDSVPAMDDPSGEPRHRHIAYDPARQHVFVANRAMNRVEIFSSTAFTRVAQITIPGASSADLSPDGTSVWIGTVTEQVVAIDASSLQIKARYGITGPAAYFPIRSSTAPKNCSRSPAETDAAPPTIPVNRSTPCSLDSFFELAGQPYLYRAAALSEWPRRDGPHW